MPMYSTPVTIVVPGCTLVPSYTIKTSTADAGPVVGYISPEFEDLFLRSHLGKSTIWVPRSRVSSTTIQRESGITPRNLYFVIGDTGRTGYSLALLWNMLCAQPRGEEHGPLRVDGFDNAIFVSPGTHQFAVARARWSRSCRYWMLNASNNPRTNTLIPGTRVFYNCTPAYKGVAKAEPATLTAR